MTTKRDIKFRAWHKERKEMLKVVSADGGGILDQRNDFHKMEDIVLMQYTGFKDFAGNEMYDGDILESLKLIDREYKTVFSIVKLKLGGGGFSWDFSWDFSIDRSILCLKTKIIGNIYENPNLIELKKVKNEN